MTFKKISDSENFKQHLILTSVIVALAIGALIFMMPHSANAAGLSTRMLMNDTVTTTGMSLFTGRPIHAEYLKNETTLYRQEIDTIELKLQKTGTPTGNATIGIFNGGTTTSLFNDTTKSSANALYSGNRWLEGEKITSSSALNGKNINFIQVYVRKNGSPTGSFDVGVFDQDRHIKRSFANVTANSITTSMTAYTYYVTSNYTLATNDVIGVLYNDTGSTSSNSISIEKDTTNGFDGTNSHEEYYDTSWHLDSSTQDMTMAVGYYASPSVKQSFSTLNVSTLTTTYTPYNFTLPSAQDQYGYNIGYILQKGDYIGIQYNGGDSNNYVNVMRDTNGGFDGVYTEHKWYNQTENKWHTDETHDLFMGLFNHYNATLSDDSCEQLLPYVGEDHWRWLDHWTYYNPSPYPFKRCIYGVSATGGYTAGSDYKISSNSTSETHRVKFGIVPDVRDVPVTYAVSTWNGTTYTGICHWTGNSNPCQTWTIWNGTASYDVVLPRNGEYIIQSSGYVRHNEDPEAFFDIITH